MNNKTALGWAILLFGILIWMVMASWGLLPGGGIFSTGEIGFGGCNSRCEGWKKEIFCQKKRSVWLEWEVTNCTNICIGRIVNSCVQKIY
jgi:hypothetical protein